MLVIKIGGPAYRIGMGGGAASSVPSGSREGRGADLDFNAVQVCCPPLHCMTRVVQHGFPKRTACAQDPLHMQSVDTIGWGRAA